MGTGQDGMASPDRRDGGAGLLACRHADRFRGGGRRGDRPALRVAGTWAERGVTGAGSGKTGAASPDQTDGKDTRRSCPVHHVARARRLVRHGSAGPQSRLSVVGGRPLTSCMPVRTVDPTGACVRHPLEKLAPDHQIIKMDALFEGLGALGDIMNGLVNGDRLSLLSERRRGGVIAELPPLIKPPVISAVSKVFRERAVTKRSF
jgi:hypothetical protein